MVTIRSISQRRYLDLLNSSIPIIIGSGPAGTGKTMLACHAGSKALINGEKKKLILTRPAVSVDEQLGSLPGSLEDKMSPFTRPMFDVLNKYFKPKDIKLMIEAQTIEICPLAFMRGRTFEDAWIIGDEMQNCTPNQMKMLLTRIGNNSKLVVAGDTQQHDRGFEKNGLSDLLTRLRPSPNIQSHVFTEEDIERHPVIKEILELYLSV